MAAISRTAKSLKNSAVALALYFVQLVLQFFSRKVFLDRLGAEVLGLNTTATNLLQFLNLAELGIGAAIACTLYKPLFDDDREKINEIVSLQGWMYRRIATVVIAGSVVLMAFFPWIFAKMELPLWYAYASFGVLLFSALLGYFVNYKQVLLSADQKEYKIQYSYKTVMLVKLACQIAAIHYFDDGYLWWLVLEALFAVGAAAALTRVVRRTYPYLRTELSRGRELRRKYPDVTVKIKQLFFHKIGGFALTQTSPVIIYAYASLTLVALYGNYMLIIMGIVVLMGAVFNSINAGVGNLVAEGDRSRILSVFEELFSLRFLIATALCFGVYTLTPAFVTLWVGSEYLLDDMSLALMVATLYINLTRSTVDAYINAYGLFRDVWAPIVEAAINIGLSVLFGYFWGLHGILAGVLVSLLLVILMWKPYFLFRCGLHERVGRYVWMYVKHLAAFAGVWVLSKAAIGLVPLEPSESFGRFLLAGAVYMAIFSLCMTGALTIVSKGFRGSYRRFARMVR